MVLLSWPVAFHAIRADRKGTVALLPALCMTKDIYRCGETDIQETLNFCVSREISGAWAVHCPVCYWFACPIAQFWPIPRQ